MTTVLTKSPTIRPAPAGYKVDISRGQHIGRVSSEWFSRPDDERFLSLTELYTAVKARADRATARMVETRDVKVEVSRDNAERLALVVPGRDEPVAPSPSTSSPSRSAAPRRSTSSAAGVSSGR